MNKPTPLRFTAVMLAAAVWTGGCQLAAKPDVSKQQLLQALGHSAKIQSYAFSGSAKLSLPLKADSGGSAATQALLSVLDTADYDWSGVYSAKPLREEATVHLTPNGSSSPYTIPFMIQDNKIYFRIPALNPDQEWFVTDAGTAGGKNGSGTQNMIQARQALSDSLTELVQAVDSKQFRQRQAKQPNGETWTTAYVTVDAKTGPALLESLQGALPGIVDNLRKLGFVTAKQSAEALAYLNSPSFKSGMMHLRIADPGELSFSYDKNGFVRRIDLNLSLTAGQGASAVPVSITLDEQTDKINQNQTFRMQTPKKVRDFNEILKFLNQAPPA